MTMVRFMVNSPVMGWAAGEEITVERSRMVTGLIDNGYVTVLEDAVPDFPADSPDQVKTAGPVGSSVRAELAVATVAVPPRTGKGSGADAWAAFLAGQGFVLAGPDMTRDELIALWDSRNG